MPPTAGYYDVVIIGAGPAGLLLSVCLSRWGYKIKHIDNRPLPTATGRADGLQPRSLEILKNLGLKRKIMAHDPAKVYEVAFWNPSKDGIVRTGTWPGCPSFIDARYPFTALLHQGLIERTFIDDLASNGTRVDRPWTITTFENDAKDPSYPLSVDLKNLDSNVIEHVRAKYLFSGEGARSLVRERLGIPMHYKDPIAHVWGVMDGVVRTNFPDIKMKCTIHSSHGSTMVIPREAGMVRLYVQIASSTDEDWNPRKTATVEEVQRAASNILMPYEISWDRVEWYSVYPIAQSIAEQYTLDHRVFLGGDACHTHSPKAGQGMNTAFHDAINLAWKLHHVESGFADRSILKTYQDERKFIAETLLNFDAQYAKLFSQRPSSFSEIGSANKHISSPSSLKQDPDSKDERNEFVETFKANCEFATGFGIAYQANIFNLSPDPEHSIHSLLFNPIGIKCHPGRIMPTANVTRVIDANVVHLENEIPFNGSFRLFVFAGRPASFPPPFHFPSTRASSKSIQSSALVDLAANLQAPGSFYTRFSSLPASEAQCSSHYHRIHNPHSPFFTIALIFAAKRSEIETGDLPPLFRNYSAHVYADDLWDQRVPDAEAAAHAKVGLSTGEGGIVVVRPDGHVGCVVALVAGTGTVEALEEYFASFVVGGSRRERHGKQEEGKAEKKGLEMGKSRDGVMARL